MSPNPSPLTTGSRAILRLAPNRSLQKLVGKRCYIRLVSNEQVHRRDIPFANILIDDGSEHGLEVKDVPLSFLSPLPPDTAEKPKRRSPLNLQEPPDERDEAERMADGVKWLEARGYIVLRVGQSRTAAICHKCSRESQPRRLIQIICKDCGSRGYSPSTNSTEGTPDTYVTSEWWPEGAQLGMEWKDGHQPGKLSQAQRALRAQRRIVVAWNLPTCLMNVYTFEARDPRITPHPDIVSFLRANRLLEEEGIK